MIRRQRPRVLELEKGEVRNICPTFSRQIETDQPPKHRCVKTNLKENDPSIVLSGLLEDDTHNIQDKIYGTHLHGKKNSHPH